MRSDYPNLELIEYIFKNKIDLINRYPMFEVEVFVQTWPNTATAFSRPGCVSGQAFTKKYTTIIKTDLGDYGVFFGNEFGYLVKNPNEKFFEDWKNHTMKAVFHASDYER